MWEARGGGEHIIHRVEDQRNAPAPAARCGVVVSSPVAHPRRWTGLGEVDLIECADCFAEPEPTTYEVRCLADTVVHRTTTNPGTGRSRGYTTVCDRRFSDRGHDPREYRGTLNGVHPEVTECPTCFPVSQVRDTQRRVYYCPDPIHPQEGEHIHARVIDDGGTFHLWGNVTATPGTNRLRRTERQRDMDGQDAVFSRTNHVTGPAPSDREHLDTLTTQAQEPLVYRCTSDHTGTTHTHSRPVGSRDTHPWDGSGSFITTSLSPHRPAPPGYERHCGPDGTALLFRNDDSLPIAPNPDNPPSQVRDTTRGESMTTQLQPGDIVRTTRASAPPSGLGEDHLYVVIGRGASPTEERVLTVTHANTTAGRGVGSGRGWTADERVPDQFRTILRATSLWFFREEGLTKVEDKDADLPRDMEELRRRIQMEAFGSEPIMQCTHRAHGGSLSGDPHRHSHSRVGGTVMTRRHNEDSMHTPLPGLWSTDPARVTHPDLSQGCDTGTEALTGENIHPVTRDALQGVRSVVLTSKPGTLSGSNLVFGCQTIPINVVQRQSGSSMVFTPEGVVVTSRATVSPDRRAMNIGDRDLSLRDINDYTTSIVVDEAAPVTPVINAVVMEHGYYGCREHAGEVLHITQGVGGDVLCRITLDGGRRPSGTTGQRRGFTRGGSLALLGHRPVAGSTTERIMNVGQTSLYSLVPIDEAEVENYSGFTTAHTDGAYIVRCNERGEVI